MADEVKVVISRYDTDGTTLLKRRHSVPIRAVVNREGERAIDTAEIDLTISVDVTQNDQLYYIQDVASTEYLCGLWNFQEAGLDYNNSNKYRLTDESGFDIDLLATNSAAGRITFDRNANKCSFSTNGDEFIAITANPQYVGTSTSIIDFSGMFDIWIRMRSNDSTHSTNEYLLDKEDTTDGIAVLMSTNGSGTGVTKLVKVSGTVSTDLITGTVTINDNVEHWIRIKRDENNDIKLYVDGTQDGSTVNTNFNFNKTAAKLVIGNNASTVLNHVWKGSINQIRLYCGGYLSDSEATIILQALQAPSVMKFGGIIWKIEDKTTVKTVYAKSFAEILNNIQINPTIANVYTTKNAAFIISDILQQYATQFLLFDQNALSASNHTPNYTATGSLIQNIVAMVITSGRTFHTTPRRILTIESKSINSGNNNILRLFRNNFNNITIDAFDDTNVVNDLEVIGGLKKATFSEPPVSASGGQTDFVLTYSPYNPIVTDNGTLILSDFSGSPAANTYKIDFPNKKIIFSTGRTAGHSIVIQYIYDTSSDNSVYFRSTGSTTNIGRYFKRIILSGYADSTQINSFATNYRTAYQTINQRITINNGNLINVIRENYLVNIIDTVKKINTSNFNVLDAVGNTLTGTNTPLVVRSITWYYPEGNTDVHVGEYMFDAYDLDNSASQKIAENDGSWLVTNQ